MARVMLLSLAPFSKENNSFHRGAYTKLRESAELDIFKLHQLTHDPEYADLIIFAEIDGLGLGPYIRKIRKHPYVKIFREKCFLFFQGDNFIPFLPGVYASIKKSQFSSKRCRPGFYLSVEENEFIEFYPQTSKPHYLYSFVGAVNTSEVRVKLGDLSHPRGFFEDTSKEGMPIRYRRNRHEIQQFWRQYAAICNQSSFILCPRGVGASSIRLFESMKMGKVPVIISDEWVPPEGPEWERFSLRIAEEDVSKIPHILESRELHAKEMGSIAREQWEKWFSEEVRFHRVVEWCLSIKQERSIPESWRHWVEYLQLLRPWHFRVYLSQRFKQ